MQHAMYLEVCADDAYGEKGVAGKIPPGPALVFRMAIMTSSKMH